MVDQTLAELKQLDIGSWKGEQWAGERIPTLAELLAIIPEGKRLFIEIKCGPEIAPRLVQVLQAAKKRPEQTCLISFSYHVMQRGQERAAGSQVLLDRSVKAEQNNVRLVPYSGRGHP